VGFLCFCGGFCVFVGGWWIVGGVSVVFDFGNLCEFVGVCVVLFGRIILWDWLWFLISLCFRCLVWMRWCGLMCFFMWMLFWFFMLRCLLILRSRLWRDGCLRMWLGCWLIRCCIMWFWMFIIVRWCLVSLLVIGLIS